MNEKTKRKARKVQNALLSLPPEKVLAMMESALDGFDEYSIEFVDMLRFSLGWLLEDNHGNRHDAWPEDSDMGAWFVPPLPDALTERIARMQAEDFYHKVLPVFGCWPELSTGTPPSSYSDGYAWMEALAEWLRAAGAACTGDVSCEQENEELTWER